MILEIERLQLQQMNQADYPDLCEILQDEEVMYAYDRKFEDADVQVVRSAERALSRVWLWIMWARDGCYKRIRQAISDRRYASLSVCRGEIAIFIIINLS